MGVLCGETGRLRSGSGQRLCSTWKPVPYGFGTTSNSDARPYSFMGTSMRSTYSAKATGPLPAPGLPAFSQPRMPVLTSALQPAPVNSSSTAPAPRPKAFVSVIPELCKGCELCVYACPSGNLELSSGLNGKGYHPAVFSYNGKRGPCTACGICYWVCPDFAISEIRRLKQ